MTFKRQMEKAIKEYLKHLGYKYNSKIYAYVKFVDDDIIHTIGFADSTGFNLGDWHLKTFVTVASQSLNEILYEVTDGIIDLRSIYAGPAYLCNTESHDDIQTDFFRERSMEENMADFERMLNTDVQFVFDRYNTLKKVYTAAADKEFYNLINTPCVWFYAPLSYFFLGEYDEAFKFIDKRIEIEEANFKRILERIGSLSEEDTEAQRAFLAMRDNLKKWIAEGRQFKVDDEYLPQTVVGCSCDNSLAGRISSFLAKTGKRVLRARA